MERKFIEIKKISGLYDIDVEFIRELVDFGLIQIYEQEGRTECFDFEDVDFLLCITRLKNDLEINNEAVEVIMNMRKQMLAMQHEMQDLRNKINSFEREFDRQLLDLPKNKGLITDLDIED